MMAVMWMMAVMDMMDTFGHSQKKAPGAENAGGLGTGDAQTPAELSTVTELPAFSKFSPGPHPRDLPNQPATSLKRQSAPVAWEGQRLA